MSKKHDSGILLLAKALIPALAIAAPRSRARHLLKSDGNHLRRCAEFYNCNDFDLLDSGTLAGSIKAHEVLGLPQGKVSITLKITETNSGQRHPCAITAVGVVTLDAYGNAIDISGTYRSCKHETGTFGLQPGPGNGSVC